MIQDAVLVDIRELHRSFGTIYLYLERCGRRSYTVVSILVILVVSLRKINKLIEL